MFSGSSGGVVGKCCRIAKVGRFLAVVAYKGKLIVEKIYQRMSFSLLKSDGFLILERNLLAEPAKVLLVLRHLLNLIDLRQRLSRIKNNLYLYDELFMENIVLYKSACRSTGELQQAKHLVVVEVG